MSNPDSPPTGKLPGATAAVCPPPTPSATAQSTLLAGRYRLEAPLGHGIASVFRARDLKTGLRHAIKRLPPDRALADGEHERFVSEVTLLSQLCHPNIVTMTALHRDEVGRSLLVMELLEGEDALTHLAGGQRLPLPRVLEITRQVTGALHAAHLRGIAHREFQLSSIFLAMQRGLCGAQVEVVKVVGFGGVKLRALPGQRARHCTLGTAEYLAPEGMPGHGSEPDDRSDQWSVAVTVYRMLSGRLPFRADDAASLQNQICTQPHPPLAELCPELPQHVLGALDRALAKDRAQRFPSLVEFMRALSGQTLQLATVAGPPPAPSAVALPAVVEAAGREQPEPAGQSCAPRPRTMSDIPTVATKIELDRTLSMEPAVLAELRAQSQLSDRRALLPSQLRHPGPVMPAAGAPPTLPGTWLMREHSRRAQRRQTLVLIVGSCVGLSLGMSAAWLLGPRATRHLRRSPLPSAAPREPLQLPAVAAASPARGAKPRRYPLGPGAGIYSKVDDLQVQFEK